MIDGETMGKKDEPKTCFVICPIGEEDSEVRKRSDEVLNYIIRPAVEKFGYSAIRSDEIDKSGNITVHIISEIANADLAIADLTNQNPNATRADTRTTRIK